MTDKEISEYLAEIGRRGGKTTGQSKVRGGPDYYKAISQKAVRARKAKALKARRAK